MTDNGFIRYTKWLPSRQQGLHGRVEVDSDLTDIRADLDKRGLLYEIHTRVAYHNRGKLIQRAIYVHGGQLAEAGVPLSLLTGKD